MTTPSETLAGILPSKKYSYDPRLYLPPDDRAYNKAIDDCHAALLKAIDEGKIKIINNAEVKGE